MPEQSRHLELRLLSDPAEIAPARRAVEAFARTCGLDEKGVAEVGLCVNEALANVIRHAYAGRPDRPIELKATDQAPGVRICIRDWGTGADPSKRPVEPRPVLKPGGLGMICLEAMMDEVRFDPQPDGMLLTLTRHAGGEHESGDDAGTAMR